jgi:hypothetical protein
MVSPQVPDRIHPEGFKAARYSGELVEMDEDVYFVSVAAAY